MKDHFRLVVVTPDGEQFDGDVTQLTAPGAFGEFGVLPHHTRYMVELGIGEIRYTGLDGNEGTLAVAGGFVEVLSDRVTILAQMAETAEQIDIHRAEAARRRAEALLAKPDPDTDIDRAMASLSRAMTRLQVAKAVGIKLQQTPIVTTEAPIPGEDGEGEEGPTGAAFE